MLWEVDIYPLAGQPDRTAHSVAAAAADVGIMADLPLAAARGYLIQGDLEPSRHRARRAWTAWSTRSSSGASWAKSGDQAN